MRNTDGTDDNRSWNCGWEGDEGVPAEVLALRRRQVRNFICLLMLVNGTPMFCAGDEFLRPAARQQQPLQPGQRNQLSRLGSARINRESFASSRESSHSASHTPRLRAATIGAKTSPGMAASNAPTFRHRYTR